MKKKVKNIKVIIFSIFAICLIYFLFMVSFYTYKIVNRNKKINKLKVDISIMKIIIKEKFPNKDYKLVGTSGYTYNDLFIKSELMKENNNHFNNYGYSINNADNGEWFSLILNKLNKKECDLLMNLVWSKNDLKNCEKFNEEYYFVIYSK